jgi:pimeloyl-ACP methyl ester carboxylesterase
MKGLASEWVRQGGDVKFEAIEGSGHLPMLDKPERFLQIVISFLE